MKTSLIPVFLFALFAQSLSAQSATAASPPGPIIFTPEIVCEDRAEPGGLVRIAARWAEGIDSLAAFLADGHGNTVSRASTFRLDAQSGESPWAGLIGVPATAPGGDYRLVVTAASKGRTFLQVAAVAVSPKRFVSEEIPLDQALTNLITVSDEKKTAEALALARAVASPHADALFEAGLFLRPVEPLRKSAGFGDRRVYRYSAGGVEASVHYGVDYALPAESPVAACARGRVIMAAARIMTGNSVVLEHMPGLYSLYFHLSEIDVKEGDVLDKGQLLGRVGQTGLATGPHLHWEVEVMGVAVDPESLLTTPILDKSPVFISIFGTLRNEGR